MLPKTLLFKGTQTFGCSYNHAHTVIFFFLQQLVFLPFSICNILISRKVTLFEPLYFNQKC